MVRVWIKGKRVLAVALLSVACAVLSARDSPSELFEKRPADIERRPAPEFSGDRPRSRRVACRALPALHTQPQGEISIVVIPPPAWRPAGDLCVRVYNRTPEAMYYSHLPIEQHLRARLWRQSRHSHGQSHGLLGEIPQWLESHERSRHSHGQSSDALGLSLFDSLPSECFFEAYLSQEGGTWAALQPGRYRICVRFWQGSRAEGPRRKRCSQPFRFLPGP